jgi:hypothetical protein
MGNEIFKGKDGFYYSLPKDKKSKEAKWTSNNVKLKSNDTRAKS